MMSQTGKEIITVDFLRNIWKVKRQSGNIFLSVYRIRNEK